MRVGIDYYIIGESVVFQYNLVDNICVWFLEINIIFVGYRRQEVVYFFIYVVSFGEVLCSVFFGLNEVVIVYGGRDSDVIVASYYKL